MNYEKLFTMGNFMKKNIYLSLLLIPLIIFPSSAKTEETKNKIKEKVPAVSCKIEKGVKITFKVSSKESKVNENTMKSLVNLMQKRLLDIGICYQQLTFSNDKINIVLPKFDKPEKIASFLSEKVQFMIKRTVNDEKGNPIMDNNNYTWMETGLNEKMITTAEVIEKQISSQLWQVKFVLDEHGNEAFNDIAGRMMDHYFRLEVDEKTIIAIISNEMKFSDFMMRFIIPTLIKSPDTNELILSNLKDDFAEKFKSDIATLKFKEIVLNPVTNKPKKELKGKNAVYVWKDSALTKQMIKSCSISPQKSEPKPTHLTFILNEKGKEIFKEITGRLNGKLFAIEVNGKIVFKPVIKDIVTSGEIMLSGNFTREEITDLINMKASIKFKEPLLDERTGEQKIDPKNNLLWTDSKLKINMIEEINKEEESTNVKLVLNDKGKKLLEEITFFSIERPIGIELNHQIISAPVVNELISSGTFNIKMQTEKSARRLVAQINSGQPEVPLSVIELKTF